MKKSLLLNSLLILCLMSPAFAEEAIEYNAPQISAPVQEEVKTDVDNAVPTSLDEETPVQTEVSSNEDNMEEEEEYDDGEPIYPSHVFDLRDDILPKNNEYPIDDLMPKEPRLIMPVNNIQVNTTEAAEVEPEQEQEDRPEILLPKEPLKVIDMNSIPAQNTNVEDSTKSETTETTQEQTIQTEE